MSSERSSDDRLRIVLVVLAVLVLLPMSMIVLAVPMMGMMGWWWGGGTASGLSPLWGIGMMLVWLVAIVGVGYLVYRWLAGSGGSSTDDQALEELRVAYARGDLSDEEFEERRSRLCRDESG